MSRIESHSEDHLEAAERGNRARAPEVLRERLRRGVSGLQDVRIRISGRVLLLWALLSVLCVGAQVTLFIPAFRETWYAPLHFIWVVATSCAVAWLCLCSGASRSGLKALALLVVSCVLSWCAARVSWGVGIVGEAELPLAGAVVIVASLSLFAVAVLGCASAASRSEEDCEA